MRKDFLIVGRKKLPFNGKKPLEEPGPGRGGGGRQDKKTTVEQRQR